MQLVKQTVVYFNGQFMACRWDNVKKVLRFQNSSKDYELSLDDYLSRRNSTFIRAKKEGWKVSEIDVPINAKWPTDKTIKELFKKPIRG